MSDSAQSILIVSNDSESAETYRRWLQQNELTVTRLLVTPYSASLDDGSQMNRADFILLDCSISGGATLNLLNQIGTTAGDFHSLVIVIGDEDVDTAVQAMKFGAADYLVRSRVTPDGLRRAIAQSHTISKNRQDKIQRLIETAPIGIGIGTADGDVKVINDVMLQLHGYSRAEFESLGMNWRDFVPPEQTQQIQRGMERLLQDGYIPPEKRNLLHRDGTQVPVWISAMDWMDGSNEHVAFAVDLSSQQQTEAELREREAELRLVTNTIPALVSFVDTTQRYRFVNQKYEEWFSRPASEICGKHVREVVGESNYETIRPYVEQALAGQDVVYESERIDEDGRVRYMNAIYAPRFDPQNNVTGFVALVIDISDRVCTEKALRRSEDRLRIALESAQLGTWDWNLETNKFIWDTRCREIFSVPPDDDISMETVYQALHPDDHDRLKQDLTEVLRPGNEGEYESEYRIIGIQDGIERWILAKGQVYFKSDGSPKRFIGTVLDITARKHTETALRESEERLQMALHGSGGGYWDWNIATNEDYLSPRWLEMLEYEADELPAEYSSWIQLIHPDDKDWVMDRLQAHLQDSSIPYQFEYRLLTKSGEWKWIANYGQVVVRDSQGHPLRMAGIHHDISDRKQTKERLRQSEDRLRIALESAQLGTWDWDLASNTLIWDARCREIFSVSPNADITIETFYQALHPDDHEQLEQNLVDVLSTDGNGKYDIEYRIFGIQDNIQRWVAARGQIYFDHDGTPKRFIGTVLDISDRKRVEAERERLLELEKAARVEAERANRIKDEFLAVLSHELRSPLNPILGWSKLMQTKSLNPTTTARALSTIERNAKLQTQLIDDLLDIAKILRGKLKIDNTPVDLEFVTRAAMDTVETAATAKSIDLQFVVFNADSNRSQERQAAPQNSKFLVHGDAARLQQIVWNVLSNAIKFTPSGGRVTVHLRQIDDHVQIAVADTGKGIRSDFLPHIFESFRQEDVSITRQFGGLGLGLAIVRYLTEAHGGLVRVDSPGEGLGATFTISLPKLHVTEQQLRSEVTDVDHDISSIQILIVDDDADSRELLETVLSRYGARVTAVASGAAALSLLSTASPDVLISDIGMPSMDGYTLIQQVRSLSPDQGGQIPAIALTAYAREEDERQALQSGYQYHIAKPIEIEQLLTAITTILQPSTATE